ncbi:MAG: DUF4105 domain-containing protein [Prevotella sp.]|nr:DUF4105 domain-containing protein [Prevotella sp.]
MKRKTGILQKIIVLFMLTFSNVAAHGQFHTTPSDSLEISLLTCTPHQKVYSIYGHSAIRVLDKSHGTDFVVNYGVFDFNSPHFIWRFTFATAEYEMGILMMRDFLFEYIQRGSGVTEQVLNLNSHEKSVIFNALRENYKPENAKYRYNFFYDNCTTRARNMIVSHLDGTIEYHNALPPTTYREYVHECSRDYPWTTFGIDLLLGVRADQPTTRKERQFLPFNLRDDFAAAVIRGSDGSERPLVKETSELLKAGPIMTGADLPISPCTSMMLFSALILLVTLIEQFWLKRIFWWFDALLMLIVGLVGVVLCALFFSKHPTISTNLQCLLFNPLPLVMLYPVVKRLHKGQGHWWWTIQFILLILFCVGSVFQDYAQGMIILACVLLYRCLTRLQLGKNTAKRESNSE